MEGFLKQVVKPKNDEVSGNKLRVFQKHGMLRKTSIDPFLTENSPDDQKQQVFTSIFNLLNLSKKKSLIGINIPSQNESNNSQSQRIKPRTIDPVFQTQSVIKNLFEEHTLTLNVNQAKSFYFTKKGLRNFETLENQDAILIERIANYFKIFGVFDGHGSHGKLIAESCSKFFKKETLKTYEQEFKRQIDDKQVTTIIKNCIKKTQLFLQASKYNEIQYSGTTALIVIVSPKFIFSFNIGNSRLVLGMKEENGEKIYDFQVTHDHDLNRFDERMRVLKHGAAIYPLKDQLGESYGPDRLWCKNEKRPGTFITRTLGLTCGSKAGIISEPEVSVLQYNKRMKFLILATDGLWGVQQNDEVISYLSHYYIRGQLETGVENLMEQATIRWKSKTQLMDDMSVIVVRLSQQNKK